MKQSLTILSKLNPYLQYLNFKKSRFISATKKPREVQEQLLKKIIEGNKKSRYGIKHNFPKIAHSIDYKNNIPINSYEHLKE